MPVTASPVAILSDNYAWLCRDQQTGAVAIVDPAEDDPIDRAIEAAGGRLDLILLTHHHQDHIAAASVLGARYGAQVVGARADAHRLPPLDQAVAEGDTVALGASIIEVIGTPGHTAGHITYYVADGDLLFCGDTLFSLGCGRLLEGTAAQLFASLAKFGSLPDATRVCCGHEYTQGNARFALAVAPANPALVRRAKWVEQRRAAGEPTLPSRLGDERQENPFVRASNVAEFTALRARKDTF